MFFNKLRNIFREGTENIAKKLTEKNIKEEDLKDILWEMEIALLESNVSLEVVEKINEKIKENLIGKKISFLEIKEIIKDVLKEVLDEIIIEGNFKELVEDKAEGIPIVLLFFGFNGVGKTTTIAKIGKMLKDKGHTIVFAAGDTYRAAAIEQLEKHAKALEIKIIKSEYGSDSAAVIYDAIEYAKAHNIEYVLADTSGRTHINKNLIDELKKIVRVTNPTVKFLVVDATTGSDIINQAKLFNDVGFDGYIVTKTDVDSKGGALLNICYAVKKPIFFIGFGQDYENLKSFKKEEVINSLTNF